MTICVLESLPMDHRQREFARRMRAEPTEAERVLWQRLRRDVALSGSHFRRRREMPSKLAGYRVIRLRTSAEVAAFLETGPV